MSSGVRSCVPASLGGAYISTCNTEKTKVAFPKKNTKNSIYKYKFMFTVSTTSIKDASTANLDVKGSPLKNSVDPAITMASFGAVYIIPVIAIRDLVNILLYRQSDM